MQFKSFPLLLCLLIYAHVLSAATVTGELKQWHKVTLDFEGPMTNELALPNPFTYYSLEVTLIHESGLILYNLPGYYAADGKSANTSATGGNVWRVHFTPPATGKWNYIAHFKGGEDAALGGGTSAGYMDGEKGSIIIAASDKELPDNRARGKLAYVGKHYLQYQGDKSYMIKVGADSPENMLHYADFDGTLNGYGKLGKEYLQLMKTWQPHAKDVPTDATKYTWQNGKGKNLIGAINYLAGKGVNAISFLTYSVDGDDGCVYPYLVKNDSLFINASKESKAWEKALHHDRFDCSKLDQWEQIFEYADNRGMFLHFKTFENEGVAAMGDNTLTRERKIYYRELIARYAHHLALNWNLSEETKLEVQTVRDIAAYIRSIDPYKNHVVQHTFPKGHGKDNIVKPNYEYYYNNLVGYQSELTGASLQLQKQDIHTEVKRWVEISSKTGKPWVVCNDEQGKASDGVAVDNDHPTYTGKLADNAKEIRHKALWGTLLAGGMGVEYYYGYTSESNDLNSEDHTTRAHKYESGKIAMDFMRTLPFVDMINMDEVSSDKSCFVFAKPNKIYVVYMPNGGTTTLSVSLGKVNVTWLNPVTGKTQKGSIKKRVLNAPTSDQDWVAMVEME